MVWKDFMKNGMEIKSSWETFGGLELGFESYDFEFLSTIQEDILKIRSELYTNLKEFFPLPKLRLECPVIEADINTSFQLHLMDFLYDQQDLYDYYENEINNKNYQMGMLSNSISVKNRENPLACYLERIMDNIDEFSLDNDLTDCLQNLRWYESCDIMSLTVVRKNQDSR
jgi:hypothetical protein